MLQTLILFLVGIVSLLLAVGAFGKLGGAGTRNGAQRLMAAMWWALLGVGLALTPFTWLPFVGMLRIGLLVLAVPFGAGWALSASANKDRMLPRN